MDKQAIKDNVTNGNQWTRILYMLLFGVILYLVLMVFWAVVVVQAIFALITGHPNSEILKFSGDLVRYLREIAAFLTYNDETKPYPFQAWQATESESDVIEAEFEEPAPESTEKPDVKTDV